MTCSRSTRSVCLRKGFSLPGIHKILNTIDIGGFQISMRQDLLNLILLANLSAEVDQDFVKPEACSKLEPSLTTRIQKSETQN